MAGKEITPTAMKAIEALKNGLDPLHVMNPGRLSGGFTFADWGLSEERLAEAEQAESKSIP